jgi:hypothetical protein
VTDSAEALDKALVGRLREAIGPLASLSEEDQLEAVLRLLLDQRKAVCGSAGSAVADSWHGSPQH